MKEQRSYVCSEFNLSICSAVIVSKQSIKEKKDKEIKKILKDSISVLEVVIEKCVIDKNKIKAVNIFKVLTYIITQTRLATTLQ